MRVGLFGGTFDPIHLGHLRAIEEVRAGFPLDRCYLIPAALPPHKRDSRVTGAEDRLDMIRLAVADRPYLTVSDVELARAGFSYTIDTVKHFKSTLSRDEQLYLVLGLDAFLEIDSWKSFRELLRQVPFVVMARPDARGRSNSAGWNRLGAFLKSNISAGYRFSDRGCCYVHDNLQTVHIFNNTQIDISSSQVRRRLRERKSVDTLVPDKIEAYILQKGLYR